MRINFLVNHIRGGWEPTDKRLGGTERGVVEWAEELVRLGHHVTVYKNGPDSSVYLAKTGEVQYFPREEYRGHDDVCINVKSPEIEPLQPTIFYTNNVDSDQLDLSEYNAVIQISQWAKDNIPVNNPNVYVVPHGYDETKIYPSPKIAKQCLYASSPDRGLETLLRAWPEVYKTHPDATLKVTYGAEPYDIEGVEFLGEVSEEGLNKLFRESDIWCHPASGGELQCIAGLKAQAAGCWPVIIPTMALGETVKSGTFSTEQNYAEDLIKALNDHPFEVSRGATIKQSTDKLLEVIEKVLE